MKQTRSLSQFLAAYYGMAFLNCFVPIFPLYALMFSEKGLSPAAISSLFAAWTLAKLFFEIPSGAFADVVSRRSLMITSPLLRAAGYSIWLCIPTYAGFLCGFLLWGMHSALLSGAREALLYDMLTERDRAADFTRAYGRMRALEAIAGGLAMIAGGALVRYSYQTVLAVSIAAPILSSAVAWIGLTEPTRHGWGRGQQYGQTLRAGLLEAARNRHVLYMVLLSLALLPLVEVLDEYVGPILHEKSFSPSSVAYWFAFIYLLQGWGMASAHRLPQSRPWAVLLIYLPAAGAVLLVPAAGPLGSALGLCVYFSLNGLLVAYFSGQLQKHITGQARATVTSVTSLATALGAIAFYVAYGLVANRHGFGSGAAFLGASTAALAVGFLGLGLWWRVLHRPSETTGDGPSGPPPAQ